MCLLVRMLSVYSSPTKLLTCELCELFKIMLKGEYFY